MPLRHRHLQRPTTPVAADLVDNALEITRKQATASGNFATATRN